MRLFSRYILSLVVLTSFLPSASALENEELDQNLTVLRAYQFDGIFHDIKLPAQPNWNDLIDAISQKVQAPCYRVRVFVGDHLVTAADNYIPKKILEKSLTKNVPIKHRVYFSIGDAFEAWHDQRYNEFEEEWNRLTAYQALQPVQPQERHQYHRLRRLVRFLFPPRS